MWIHSQQAHIYAQGVYLTEGLQTASPNQDTTIHRPKIWVHHNAAGPGIVGIAAIQFCVYVLAILNTCDILYKKQHPNSPIK